MKTNLLKSIFISLILLVGATNAWAGEGFYGIFIKYNHNGTPKTSDGEWTNPLSLGTLTSDFKVTDVYLKVWWEYWSPAMSAQLHYWKDGSEMCSGTFNNVKSTGGNNREVYVENWNKVLATTTEASGTHEITYKWEAYFSSVTHTLPSSGTKKITYTVAPPSVKNFDVKSSGHLSGSGTEADPYIIKYNGSFTLTLSGSQNHTDANSTIKYNTSGTWNTTATKTISDVNSSDIKNVTLKARYTNKTDATLSGTESSKTIYYRAENSYSVTINSNDQNMGTVNPSGSQTIGQLSQTTIAATPKTGYYFVNWSTTGGVVIVDESINKEEGRITVTATDAGTVTANFEAIPETKYAVTISSAGNGTVSPSGTQQIGASGMDVTATPAIGYQFDGWKVTGRASVKDENSATTTITATAVGTVTAHFSEIKYTIPVSSNNNNYGTVNTESVSVGISTYATISATPEVGYKFKQWQVEGGAVVASTTDATTTITATGTGSVTATFEETKYTIGVVSSNVEFGTVGTASISVGQHTASANITATEKTGCEFVGWIATDGIIIASPSNKTTTIKATKEGTLTAVFKEKPANTVYFKPQSWWKDDDARTAIWAWKENSNPAVQGWVDVDYDDCTGNILRAEIPAKYDRIKFVRLKPSSADGYKGENNGYHWDNEWNSTETLIVPTDNKNLYDMNNTTITKLYFTPHDNWKQADARFAAYFFKGETNAWKSMTLHRDGIYVCDIPNGFTGVIFCRMNPSAAANSWNNKWNQTGDITLLTNGQNHYSLNGGEWDAVTGEWHTAWDDSRWTSYTAPTYTVTINPCENGTITVVCNDQTYTSSTENVTIPNVTIHTELNITFTPADGYILTTPLVTYADVVADNIYSICGPAVISAEFVPQGTTKTIYLRPNDDWLKDDAIFIAHAWKENSSDQHDYLMTTKDDDYTGSYSCTIDSKYDHVLFARINPEYKTNQELSEKWMWNKTKDLQITDDILDANGYRFAIQNKVGGSGSDKDFYDGKWEENTPIWGITADFNLWHAEDAIFRGYPGKVDILLHSGTHEFLLYNIKTGSYFHNNGTYTRNHSGQWWTMNEQNNCKLVADVDKAIYHFQMQYVTQVGEFKNQISITYPSTEVYYLAYQEGDNTKSFRKSHALNKITEGEKEDVVSFFVDIEKSPYIYLLDAKNNILSKHPIVETGGEHPNTAMLPGKRNSPTLSIGSGCGVTNSGVYNFVLHQEGNTAQIDAAATHPYNGNYYIRTDASEGGWNDFRQESNQMTYSSYAESHSNFNHYFCKWVENNNGAQSNVKFTIANDYSFSLSDTLNSDKFIEKVDVQEGCLPESANVRFGWDSRTNEVSRAYIKGSSTQRFLVLVGKDDNLKDKGGKELNNNEAKFIDQNNWIYQVDVTANNETKIKLIAEYNGDIQYFKGSAEDYTSLLSSTAANSYKIRLVYDFKSNHIVTAMILDGDKDVTTDDALGTDMMVIRKDQEQAEQLTFNPDVKKLSDVGTVYAVMTFTSKWINGSATTRERSLYWVSFPFDVKISDVFGFGEYAEHWIIQYYDGAERAEKGLFADSGTYWKYIFDTDTKLKAGQGYVLVLDLNKVTFPHGATEVSLYFPSTDSLRTISGELPTADTVPEHWCTIDREWTDEGKTYYHKYTDSHWNLIGVPGFADINFDLNVTKYHFMQDDASFYYNFNLEKSTYTVEASQVTEFQAMYAYMVQFAGTIDWTSSEVIGATPTEPKLAARRYSDDQPEKVVLRLELAQGEDVEDRTFVQLQQEGATSEFDLSVDLTKIINSGANIYTLAGEYNIQVAGNALPMEEAVVPVGVDIATAGEYTFRMPDGTEGMVVELLDYEANTRTNLLLSDYTVTLQKGSNENRFALYIQPSKSGVSTSIENVDEGVNGGEAVMKYLIDGKLFIRTADGVLYDAQGHRL